LFITQSLANLEWELSTVSQAEELTIDNKATEEVMQILKIARADIEEAGERYEQRKKERANELG
jgi:hypothetical protein